MKKRGVVFWGRGGLIPQCTQWNFFRFNYVFKLSCFHQNLIPICKLVIIFYVNTIRKGLKTFMIHVESMKVFISVNVVLVTFTKEVKNKNFCQRLLEKLLFIQTFDYYFRIDFSSFKITNRLGNLIEMIISLLHCFHR